MKMLKIESGQCMKTKQIAIDVAAYENVVNNNNNNIELRTTTITKSENGNGDAIVKF